VPLQLDAAEVAARPVWREATSPKPRAEAEADGVLGSAGTQRTAPAVKMRKDAARRPHACAVAFVRGALATQCGNARAVCRAHAFDEVVPLRDEAATACRRGREEFREPQHNLVRQQFDLCPRWRFQRRGLLLTDSRGSRMGWRVLRRAKAREESLC
jgi:hypothetical protein